MDRVRRDTTVVVPIRGHRDEQPQARGLNRGISDVAHHIDDDMRRVGGEHADGSIGTERNDGVRRRALVGDVVDRRCASCSISCRDGLQEPWAARFGCGDVDDQC